MMLYKNMKAMVHSPDSNTNFFNIVTGILQGDTLVPCVYNLPRLRTTNINRSNKGNGFTLKKDLKNRQTIQMI